MHLGPIARRWLAAIIVAIGLLAVFAAPSMAQDAGTPVVPDPPDAQGGPAQGTLHLLFYLCDGQAAGLSFDVADPGLANPDPPITDCALATAADDTHFLIYIGGDPNNQQEITTVDGVADVTLDETTGTPDKIVQELPPNSQDTPAEADFEIVAGQTTGVNAILFRTGTVDVHAYTCDGDPANNAFQVSDPADPQTPFDDSAYADCTPFEGDFYVAPFGDENNLLPDPITTTDGSAIVDTIPTTTDASGSHLIKLLLDGSTDPKTYTDPASFDVQAGKVTQIVWVQYAAPTGNLVVQGMLCNGDGDTQILIAQTVPDPGDINGDTSDCGVYPDRDFSIYLFGDMNSEPLHVTTDDTGLVDVQNLPITDNLDQHVIVDDASGVQTSFDIHKDEPNFAFVFDFQPVQVTKGSVAIQALQCAGITTSDIYTGAPGDLGFDTPNGCSATTSRFLIYRGNDTNNAPVEVTVEGVKSVDFDVDGSESFLIQLVDTDDTVLASGNFTIGVDQTTPVQVRTPAYGSLAIYSYLCTGDGTTGFDVFAPGDAPDLPTDCDTLDSDFIIEVFGSSSETFTVSASGGPTNLDGVPATDYFSHIITTSNAAETAPFDVAPGTTTSIVYEVWQPADTSGSTSDTSDSENVTTTADTGIGPAGGLNDAMALFGLWSIVAIAGFAAYSRRRIS